MDVDPPEPAPHQGMGFDEGEHFVLTYDRGLREIAKQPQDLASATQRAAGEFADNERMAEHGLFEKEPSESSIGDA